MRTRARMLPHWVRPVSRDYGATPMGGEVPVANTPAAGIVAASVQPSALRSPEYSEADGVARSIRYFCVYTTADPELAPADSIQWIADKTHPEAFRTLSVLTPAVWFDGLWLTDCYETRP